MKVELTEIEDAWVPEGSDEDAKVHRFKLICQEPTVEEMAAAILGDANVQKAIEQNHTLHFLEIYLTANMEVLDTNQLYSLLLTKVLNEDNIISFDYSMFTITSKIGTLITPTGKSAYADVVLVNAHVNKLFGSMSLTMYNATLEKRAIDPNSSIVVGKVYPLNYVQLIGYYGASLASSMDTIDYVTIESIQKELSIPIDDDKFTQVWKNDLKASVAAVFRAKLNRVHQGKFDWR